MIDTKRPAINRVNRHALLVADRRFIKHGNEGGRGAVNFHRGKHFHREMGGQIMSHFLFFMVLFVRYFN